MKIHDSVVAVALFALALAVVLAAQRFPPAPGQPVGPGLFPTVVGVCLGLAAVLLFVRGRKASGPHELVALAPALRRPRSLAAFLLAPLAVVFYLGFSEQIGFLPCSVLILIVLFTAYGVRLRLGVPLAVGVSLVIFGFFGRVLSVPLPRGVLDAFL